MEHDGEGFHRDIEMPCCHPGHLPMSVPTPLYWRPTHIDLIVSVQPLLPEHSEASSENRHRETGIHRALNANVAVVRELPIKGWRIDVFSKGGSVSVLNEDPEELRGRLGEILLNILLHVDDER